MHHRIIRSALLLTFAFTAPAFAEQKPATPTAIVETLYVPYQNDTTDLQSMPSALELIYPFATEELKAAIDREHACQEREQGICNIDFDILVNAQDWERMAFRISLEREENMQAIVAARFVSGKANTILFSFEKNGAEWQIKDIEAIRYTNKMAEEAEDTVSLKALLPSE